MILPRTPPCFLVQMPLHQHLVNVRVCIPFPGLMDRIRTFPKCHRRDSIILRHNDIAFMTEIDQLVVHCVRAGTNHDHLAVIRVQDMIRVAKQCRPDMIFFCDFLHDTHDRAGIGIYKYLHDLFPLTLPRRIHTIKQHHDLCHDHHRQSHRKIILLCLVMK